MTCTNRVIRFGLSDPNGVTGFNVDTKVEAGAVGLLVRGSTQVGGICCDYSGNIYVTDPAQHHIVKIDEGGEVSVFAGLAGTSGNNAGAKVSNTAARFNTPMGICCDKSGNIYVADSGNNQIRVIKGGFTSTVAGSIAGASGRVDGVGATARFTTPYGITVDNSGTLFVTDNGSNLLRKIFGNGRVLTIAGNLASGAAGDLENVEANGQSAIFRSPTGVVADPNGNVFVLDSGNFKIKKVTPNGWVYLHSGSGVRGHSLGTRGITAATSKQYTCTYEKMELCAMDQAGNLYIVDWSEDYTRLLKVNYMGEPSEIADFSGTAINQCPFGVAISPAQKIFVTFSGYEEERNSSSSDSSESSSSYVENWSSSSQSESSASSSSSSS